jgi:hypothetical protein
MPRFYFHIQVVDGVREQDDVGADFPSEAAAIAEATAFADAMMVAATKADHNVTTCIDVTDERGNPVLRVDCTAAIQATVARRGA